MKYKVYGKVVGYKYLGEVEADSKEDAEAKGWELDKTYVSLCHQCAHQVEDPEMVELDVEVITPDENQ